MMEVLCAKQRYSLKRITTGESTPVSFVSTVGVGVGANFLTTDMEDEPPFSLKKRPPLCCHSDKAVLQVLH